jgi:hypothetical protein
MQTFAPAAVVGILSAAANVVEKQAKNATATATAAGDPNGGNVFFNNASLWGDIAIGAYSVLNYTMARPMYPTDPAASLAMAGAGVALLGRRAADYIGATFLKLPTGSRYQPVGPGRSMMRGRPSLRSPGAAVESGIMPRKRQFFSVT